MNTSNRTIEFDGRPLTFDRINSLVRPALLPPVPARDGELESLRAELSRLHAILLRHGIRA